MSVFVRQNAIEMEYTKDAWAILNPIEQSIKAKIEKYDTPLKKWDISINYGIKTGCNEAFIITGEKRKELIAEDPKSDEIIRPILRGRDIKRYGYEFADLWLINIECGFTNKHRGKTPPEEFIKSKYPAIYKHFMQVSNAKTKGKGLINRDDKGDYWWELRSCAYTNDFSRQKIIYQELTQESSFYFDREAKFYVSNTAYLITGERLEFLTHILNSKIIEFVFRKFYSTSIGEKGIRWLNQYIINLPIYMPTLEENKTLCNSKNLEKIIANYYHLTEEEYIFILKNTHYLK